MWQTSMLVHVRMSHLSLHFPSSPGPASLPPGNRNRLGTTAGRPWSVVVRGGNYCKMGSGFWVFDLHIAIPRCLPTPQVWMVRGFDGGEYGVRRKEKNWLILQRRDMASGEKAVLLPTHRWEKMNGKKKKKNSQRAKKLEHILVGEATSYRYLSVTTSVPHTTVIIVEDILHLAGSRRCCPRDMAQGCGSPPVARS